MDAARQRDLANLARQAESALKLDPNNVAAIRALAPFLLASNRSEDAAILFERLSRLRPAEIEPLQSLGVCMLGLGRIQAAVDAFQRAVELEPDNAGLRFNLAALLDQANDPIRSLEQLEIGLRVEPGHLPARKAHVASLIGMGRYEEALTSAQLILKRAPGDAEAQESVAQALHALKRYEAAEKHVQAALAANPRNYGVMVEAGYLNLEVGDFVAARDSFEAAVKAEPERGAAYYGLTLCSFDWRADHELLSKMKSAAQRRQITPQEHAQLQFALGKVFEEFGEYRRSIEHYDQANRLVLTRLNATRPFDIRHTETALDHSLSHFTKQFLARQRPYGDPSELPLLVFGMPRSGTTLVEQILASHPEVAGAGELPFWSRQDPFGASSPGPASIAATAGEYRRLLGEYGSSHRRVVDKYPGNFLSAGVIHTHFPNATLVHVKRNPLDTCLSIWSTYLPTPPGFCGDRTHIVQFYRQYARAMDHWRSVLPAENLVEVEYERLIANPEPEIRSLVAACGLAWSDACLHPERRQARVTTATVSRVRVPIDATRVARWKNYEPWLGVFQQLAESAKP